MKFDTIERLLTMLLLQKANLPTFQAQVGATNAEIEEISNDVANLQFLIDFSALVDTNKKTVTKIKQQVYNGDPDETVSPFPVFTDPTPPFPLLAGSLERAVRRNRRYKRRLDIRKRSELLSELTATANQLRPKTSNRPSKPFPPAAATKRQSSSANAATRICGSSTDAK